MSFSQFLIRGASCLALYASLASAQSIAVLTGSQGTSTTIPVISVNPYGPLTTVDPVPPGAFQLLSKPDGFKYYLITNTSTGITVLNQNFASPRQIATSIQTPPTKAALSPDGRYLVVLAGSSVYVIDTQTDTLRNPNGITVSGTPSDLAFSVDGLTAYVLSNGSFAANITPISLGTLTVGTALTRSVLSAATSLSTGPTGLLYLTEPNALVEINPTTLQVTPNGVIAVNGTPGRPVFSADARYAYSINRTPITGAAIIFDLSTRSSVLVSNSNLGGAVLDRIIPVSSSRVLAYSSQNHTIYEVGLGGGLTTSGLNNIFAANSINQVLPSSQTPVPTLYVSTISGTSTTLNQVDLGTNSIQGQQSIPTQSGQLLVWAAANPTSGAATLLTFNASQTVASGDTSRPLAVRILDSNGLPVFGAKVDFSAPAGIALSATSAFTNAEGFAAVYATAGTTAGLYNIQVSSQGIANAPNFTINIPAAGGGGGGCTQNCTAATLQVVTGNGQIISEQATASQLLKVRVKDASGTAVNGATVSFSVTQGLGTISCTTIGDTFPDMPTGTCTRSDSNPNLVVAKTDENGEAAVKYLSTSIFGQSFSQTVVTATSGDVGATFTITTVLVARPNNGGQASLPIGFVIAPVPEASGYRVIRGTAGQTVPGAIQVQVVAADGPQIGQPIPNVALNVSGFGDPATTPSASCAGGTPLTNADGIATCDVVLGPVLAQNPTAIKVNVGGAIDTSLITVVVTQGQAAKVNVVSGDQQSGKTGQQFTLRGRVVDAAGNPVPNTAVVWTVTQGSGTLSGSSAQTDAQGNAQTTVTLGANPGNLVVRLAAGSASNAPSATFTLSVVASAAGIAPVSGGGQTANVGQQFANPIVVKVVDSTQNPVQGATVNFTVTNGTASPSSATTDANGLASTIVTAGQVAGGVSVTASIGTSSPASFLLTARVPGPSITASSFRNAASGASGLSPCGIAIVSGSGLGAGIQGVQTVQPAQFVGQLPYTLAGVSLEVNGNPAPIYWVSNEGGQEAVAFQTPCETNPGAANVAIHVNGGNTTVAGVSVLKFQPGIFETVYNGKKFAVLLHAKDGSYVTPTNPVHAGEQVVMFLTGLGPVTPSTGTNQAGIGGQTPIASIITGVNNGGVRVVKSEYMPGAIGIYTVTFEVPADTQTGPYQNLGFIVHDPADPVPSIYAPGSFMQILP